MNTTHGFRGDERGIALVVTLLVVLVIGALVTGAAVVGANHVLITRYYDRQSILENAADAGLELGRVLINADNGLYPDDGYNVLENGATVTGPDGTAIPGVRRWLYVGPSGVTSGQYGIFGSIVAVVEDAGGGRVIRRQQVNQESFAKYAYFTDIEPSNIRFGGGDAIWGPVHSNSPIRIWDSGATFHGTVRTAQDVQDEQFGTFMQGFTEWVPEIPMPNTTELDRLRVQAQMGNTHFVGDDDEGHGETTMRIEFVAIDVNGDGDVTDGNEGFIKVYRNTADPDHVTAEQTWSGSGDNIRHSTSCGAPASDGQFYTMDEFDADLDPDAGMDWDDAADSPNRRCLLGGDDRLNYPLDTFVPNDAFGGAWIAWGGTPDADLVTAVGATYAQYLHPINRPMNPNFKGVIMVDGKVAISGVIRGRVTIAATNDIILADDYVYATDPGDPNRDCRDILGIFSGDDVVVADNGINRSVPTTGDDWDDGPRSFDETPSEFFHGIVLALNIFTVEDYDEGPTWTEPCDLTTWGRSCLRLTGGIIQSTRGAVGTGSGTGYLKRYSYDQCGAEAPPPYFPTTGHFVKNQYFQVDPTNFDIASYWALITP